MISQLKEELAVKEKAIATSLRDTEDLRDRVISQRNVRNEAESAILALNEKDSIIKGFIEQISALHSNFAQTEESFTSRLI